MPMIAVPLLMNRPLARWCKCTRRFMQTRQAPAPLRFREASEKEKDGLRPGWAFEAGTVGLMNGQGELERDRHHGRPIPEREAGSERPAHDLFGPRCGPERAALMIAMQAVADARDR